MTFNLSDVCIGGGSYGIAASAVEYSSELPTYLRITDINDDGTLNFDGLKSVDDESSSKYLLKPNDIVFARTGASTGRNYFYDGSDGNFVYAGFLIKFSIDPDKVNPRYINYYCRSKTYFDWVSSFNTGSTRGNINAQTLSNMPIVDISREQQDTLVDTLSVLDARIAENRKINHHLEQMAQAIFKSWFVDFEPFGGEAPHSWAATNLEAITSLICRGIAPKYLDYSVQMIINQKCIRNHMIDVSLARTHTPKAVNEKWIQYGDLLINSTGEGTLGRTAPVWFKPHNLTVDSHVTIVRPASEALIFYVGLWGIVHEREIEDLHTGSTGQTELPRDCVKAMTLLLPDDGVLRRFNRVLAPIADALISNQKENTRLAELRDTLLPRLMSGELSVTDTAAK